MNKKLYYKAVALIVALTLAILSEADASNKIAGIATVTDGDTLKINGQKIRLHGIDAPEKSQTCTLDGKKYACGQTATLALAELIAGKTVVCKINSTDRYKRYIAICSLDNTNINAYMVEKGWALAYRQYSTAYVKQEQIAQSQGLGIWSGHFIEPWAYRKRQRK